MRLARCSLKGICNEVVDVVELIAKIWEFLRERTIDGCRIFVMGHADYGAWLHKTMAVENLYDRKNWTIFCS